MKEKKKIRKFKRNNEQQKEKSYKLREDPVEVQGGSIFHSSGCSKHFKLKSLL